MINKKVDKLLTNIAKDELFIETLETRMSDDLDFHDTAVWSIRKALERAYQLGLENGTNSGGAEHE